MPGSGVSLEPDGGVPVRGAELPERFVPMFGQLGVEPELGLLVPDPAEVEVGAVVAEPDVELLDDELVPVFPDEPVVVVVAALATRAPPVARPPVNAPTARMWRRRICMLTFLSSHLSATRSGRQQQGATPPWVPTHSCIGRRAEFGDRWMTIHRNTE